MPSTRCPGRRQQGVFAATFCPLRRDAPRSHDAFVVDGVGGARFFRTIQEHKGAGMLPLYAARIEDLGHGDLVKIGCANCHHVALLTQTALLRAGLSPAAKFSTSKGGSGAVGAGERAERSFRSSGGGTKDGSFPNRRSPRCRAGGRFRRSRFLMTNDNEGAHLQPHFLDIG